MSGLVRNGRRFLAVMLVLVTALGGCTFKGEYSEKDFVGKWTSTKYASPIYLYENGEWEVISDTGGVTQYGVWQVTGNKIMWSFKLGGKVHHVREKIQTLSTQEFTLGEGNKVSTFKRI